MRIQIPTTESNWLYQDVNEDRWFTKEACLPDNAQDLPECTDAEKVTWNMDFSKDIDLSDNQTGNDLVPSGSTCQTNLEQFLVNFRDHIALRLTDNGSGKTLTLSQAVRNAIHAAESTYGIEDIIVNQKHWTLSPAPSA